MIKMVKFNNNIKVDMGRLFIDGVSVRDISKSYGTPTYVYSRSQITENFRVVLSSIKSFYKKSKLLFPIKSNSNKQILGLLKNEGAGADCASPGEIDIAFSAGFSKEDILYTGNYLSASQLLYGVKKGIKINLDDIQYIDLIKSSTKTADIDTLSFRINPGLGFGSHKGIVTGGRDAKFGIRTDRIKTAYKKALSLGIKKFGIHMMAGSNELDWRKFGELSNILVNTAGKLSDTLGIEFEFIDFGGGFGIPYIPGTCELDIKKACKSIADNLKQCSEAHNIGSPWIYLEPGRYVVGNAGLLLASVTSVKDSYSKFIGCNAGMNVLLRPALYGAYHHVLLDGKINASLARSGYMHGKKEKVSICGQICENTDIIARDRKMPLGIKSGDTLILCDAGAYGFSMSSNYNNFGYAKEVLCYNGKAKQI